MKKLTLLLIALVAISSAKADIVVDSLNRMIFTPTTLANGQPSNMAGIELQYLSGQNSSIQPFRIFQQNNATWMKWVADPGVVGIRSFAINNNGFIRIGDFSTGNSYSYTTPQMLTIHNQSGVGLHIDQKNANDAIKISATNTNAYFINGVVPTMGMNGLQLYESVFSVSARGIITCNDIVCLSDQSHKRNIKSVTNALDGLREVNPVSYILTDGTEDNAPQSRSRALAQETGGDDVFQPDTVVNADIDPEVIEAQNQEYNRTKYGFIAQELEEIFPNVVYTMPTGDKGIAYHELIPILVSAIQELQGEIDALKEETDTPQRRQAPASVQDATIDGSAMLMQNTPNPFNQATEIGYRLPEDAATALIMVCDMNGKMLQTYPLPVNTTAGTLTIQAGSYTPGMYLYTLLVDGNQIDTKQMIILAH